MDSSEYSSLFQIENDHWFYKGKREIIRYWMKQCIEFFPPSSFYYLDAGAGSGLLLKMLEREVNATGVEYSSVALKSCVPGVRLIQASLTHLPFISMSFDGITALDVLEHVKDDRQGLRELIRVCKSGGYIFISVPAFSCLWSEWDEKLDHYRRYTKSSFKKLIDEKFVSLERMFYANNFLFFLIWGYRFLYKRMPFLFFGRRMEDKIPPRWINELLKKLFVIPAKWRGNKWFPFGVSLFVILKKK